MSLNEFLDSLGKTVRNSKWFGQNRPDLIFFFPISIYFLLFYILISLINIQNFSRCFFFFPSSACSVSALAGNFFYYFFLPHRKLLQGPKKSSPSSPHEIQPKIKIRLPGETSSLHLCHRQKGPKITNSGDQQKGPKMSKNTRKK